MSDVPPVVYETALYSRDEDMYVLMDSLPGAKLFIEREHDGMFLEWKDNGDQFWCYDNVAHSIIGRIYKRKIGVPYTEE